jgi:hypothetical protein
MATEESKQIFCWEEIVWEEKMCAGDPVHAGDKALMRESPTQRGRVNRYAVLYAYVCKLNSPLK